MFRSTLEVLLQLLGLANDTKESKEKIKTIHSQMDDMAKLIQTSFYEIGRVEENEAHEREKMALRLENALLRSDRNLLPAGRSEADRFAELEAQVEALQREVENLKKRLEEAGL